MISGAYESILEELGKELEIGELTPDSNNSCLIKLKNGIEVQIEPDERSEELIIGTDFGAIPPGPYRTNLFIACLKSNVLPLPHFGTFAYSKQEDHLVFYITLPLQEIRGQNVAEALAPFAEKALIWKNAVTEGSVPEVTPMSTSERPGGVFGLTP